MRAIDFWNEVGIPCVSDFNENPHTLKNIAIAIWAIDATFSHLYWENNPEGNAKGESSFKAKVIESLPDFKYVLEASNSLKHAMRSGGATLSAGSDSIQNRERGWGEAQFGVDEFDGGPIPLLEFRDGKSASLKYSIQKTVEWLEDKLSRTI